MKNITSNKTSANVRNRRFGKKVLLADRLAHALNPTTPTPARRSWSLPTINRKLAVTICILLAVVGGIGFGGSQLYLAKVTASQEAAAVKERAAQQAKSRAADACRREKAKLKADQIGKVTYDELYDYDECDK